MHISADVLKTKAIVRKKKQYMYIYALLIIHFIGDKHNFEIIKNKFKKSEDSLLNTSTVFWGL